MAKRSKRSRALSELRYRLLPYIYELAARRVDRGLPLIRPLVFDFPDDAQALDQTHSYMFGPALLSPRCSSRAWQWPVYLPQSGRLVRFLDRRTSEGGRWHEVAAPLERIPLHVRAGSVLPLGPVVQSTAGALGRDLDLRSFRAATARAAL